MDAVAKDEERMACLAKQLAVARRLDSRLVTLTSHGYASGHEGIYTHVEAGIRGQSY